MRSSPRRVCTARLRALDLPSSLDIAGLVAHVSARRRRSITLMPLRGLGPNAPCGVCVATPATDFVLYRDDTSPVHQAHIILHELSHLIFGHAHGLGGDYARLLLPNLGTTAIQHILGRSAYTVREEREAETMASLLATRMARASHDGEAARPGRYQNLLRLLK